MSNKIDKCEIQLTNSIQLGLVVWFCSGQELPAQPSMDKSRESSNKLV